YQNRPKLFERNIKLPELLYERAIEIEERVGPRGELLTPLVEDSARRDLQSAYDDGVRSVAIVLMHGYRFSDHEIRVAEIAREIGFTQVSVSHEVSPLMKLVGRGDTTVVDAYLSPILRRYVDQVGAELGDVRLMFMQSNGGLTDARLFQGKDSILSGPAGGIVGAVRTAAMAGYENIIGFDMGGTSTDVSHYAGEYERAFETLVAGVRMRAPMMQIHTVAAGGGSILSFRDGRLQVGPESAGADPGPSCYRRGGPLTVTDCNVMLGKVQPDYFPYIFGTGGDEPLDRAVVAEKFAALADRIQAETGDARTPVQVADGFLKIAIENMANAIKEISIQRGYDVTEYTLACFGGAGGQHACLVADALGMTRVFLHPFAGVLSAYGMGLADIRAMRERAVEGRLDDAIVAELDAVLGPLAESAASELRGQGVPEANISVLRRVHVRYDGTDSALVVDFGDRASIVANFEAAHRQRYGFVVEDKPMIVEAVSVEAVGVTDQVEDPEVGAVRAGELEKLGTVEMYAVGKAHQTPVYDREVMQPGDQVDGPAIIRETTATTVVEPGWRATVTNRNHMLLERVVAADRGVAVGTEVDPVMLEVFNNLFMSIAEQMGSVLENTSYSVNMKERLDFSCAIFDQNGDLIANAPHMPVHLGSMSESVRTVIRERRDSMNPGDVYVLNAPYNGGTHLPDVTVITPVFDDEGRDVLFYVGSRGHHADIGGHQFVRIAAGPPVIGLENRR
ncbi:MAG: hydantoinase/oxoprolinase family protein, partial [Pseudomonadota bacterium]